MRRVVPAWVIVLALIGAASPARPSQAQSQPSPPTPSGEPIQLSILDAVGRALDRNLGVLTSAAKIDRARGERWLALSRLLPTVNGRLAESLQKTNLEAFGFGAGSGPLPPGFRTIVGPFNVFDARVYVSQSILNFGALNNLRSETHSLGAARFSYQSARDLVVLVTANAYLQALAAAARAESARAQVQTAQALHQQAVDLKQGGLVAGIDVLRAQLQMNTQLQRATTTRNDYEKAKLQLARIIGLPPGQTFTLTDTLPEAPAPDISLDEALDRAYKSRPDYQAALERVRAAEATRAAVVGDALPSVQVTADYGGIGLTPGTARGTFAVVGAVTVPIFQGGRVRGRLLQADADLRDRRAEAEDQKAGIYYDVRTAFLDLEASGDQLKVAGEARDLAAQELTAARDRFAAGIASNVEVVQAQEAVALAGEQYISALYSYNVSKAALARGLGVAEDMVRQLLGGSR